MSNISYKLYIKIYNIWHVYKHALRCHDEAKSCRKEDFVKLFP